MESARFDKGLAPKPAEYIPKTWLIFEEAHLLADKGNSNITTRSITRVAKEGRKIGLSSIFCSQRPSSISDEIISQLDCIISHQLVFVDDVKQFFKRNPASIPDGIDSSRLLRNLPKGCAVIGDARSPGQSILPIRIRPRKSLHGGGEARC